MKFRTGVKIVSSLLVLTALPLGWQLSGITPSQRPAPPGPKMRSQSVAVLNSTLSTLCVVTNSCPPLKPLITSVLPFSSITPGGGVIVQGENFAADNGSFGQFELILSSGKSYPLENLQWGDTFAAGTIPAYWGKQGDTSGSLRIVRSDSAISNPIPVAFVATRDFAVLPPSDVQANCSDGAHDSTCGSQTSVSVAASHNTIWGHDMGTDQFTANLENGWVFYDMDFNPFGVRGSVQPPAGFNAFSNSVQLKVHWDQDGGGYFGSDGAWTEYEINLYIMGPKGVVWKGYAY